MSLNWNCREVANWDELTKHPIDPERMHPVAERILWMTMFVDIGHINKDNVGEFAWRMRLLQLADNQPDIRLTDGTDIYLTEADVRRFIGLRTNVITLNRARWLKHAFSTRRLPPASQDETAREYYDRKVCGLTAVPTE